MSFLSTADDFSRSFIYSGDACSDCTKGSNLPRSRSDSTDLSNQAFGLVAGDPTEGVAFRLLIAIHPRDAVLSQVSGRFSFSWGSALGSGYRLQRGGHSGTYSASTDHDDRYGSKP